MEQPIPAHKPAISTLYFFYSAVLLSANSLLSYADGFSLETKIIIFVVGIILPSILIWGTITSSAGTTSFSPDKKDWLLLVAALLLMQVLSLYVWVDWPKPDEGLMGFYSTSLAEKWRWAFFFSHAQTPPLSTWLLALIFKLFHPSAFILKLFPAFFIVAACAGAVYIGSRLFDPALTFIVTALFGLSFWPIYLGRLCDYSPALFFWEILCFSFLAQYLVSSKEPSVKSLIGFGFVSGLGLGLASAWPLALLCLATALLLVVCHKHFGVIRSGAYFLVPVLLIMLVYGLISMEQKNGKHLLDLFFLSGHMNWIQQLRDSLSNITGLFWGCDLQNSYGPVWGGLLNPFLTTAFILGSLRLVRSPKDPLSLCAIGFALIFLTPGFASKGYNVLRLTLAAPFILFIAGFGLWDMTRQIPKQWRIGFAVLLLAASTLLDTIHINKARYFPTQNAQTAPSAGTNVFANAFTILNAVQKDHGPGLILLGLDPEFDEQTLGISVYPFNTASNPALFSTPSHWVAWMDNIHYQPFLERQFPNLKTYDLGPDNFWNQGSEALFLVPLTPQNQGIFTNWVQANHLFRSLDKEALFDHSNQSLELFYEKFLSSERALKNDPFLESVFYEKALYLMRNNYDLERMRSLLGKAIQKGYPAPHLLVSLGILDIYAGKKEMARKLFEQALKSKFNRTNAQIQLQLLNKNSGQAN